MSEEKNFVDGMMVKLPDNNAPNFVKLKISLKLDELGPWIAAQKSKDPSIEWINIEIKESRSGKWYAERNMWKPSDTPQPARQPAQQTIPKDDIPW
tara:strand:+ start:1574 stop:1861 length:288 start_codon:yes stop_codon:yes gene_type:complete